MTQRETLGIPDAINRQTKYFTDGKEPTVYFRGIDVERLLSEKTYRRGLCTDAMDEENSNPVKLHISGDGRAQLLPYLLQ